jgi:hypothetical protein
MSKKPHVDGSSPPFPPPDSIWSHNGLNPPGTSLKKVGPSWVRANEKKQPDLPDERL